MSCAAVLTIIRARIGSGAMPHDPQSIVEELIKLPMTEGEIVDELRKLGVETTQPTINRIKKGVHKTTMYDLGRGLETLYEQRCPQQLEQRA